MAQAVINPAVEWVNQVLADKTTTLEPSERFVLARVADHFNRRTLVTFVGVPRLMRETGYSDKGVRNALNVLEAAGYLHGKPRPGSSTEWSFPQLTLDLSATPVLSTAVVPATAVLSSATPVLSTATPVLSTDVTSINNQLEEPARSTTHANSTRCPARIGYGSICSDECDLCGGTQHVPLEAAS